MEYFIIDRGAVWSEIQDILARKASEGVEVRLMYDDLGTIALLPSSFPKQMKALNIKCIKFNEYNRLASALYNNRDHRKITVVDGEIGFVGGANIADEYANLISPYGYWKDSAVKIKGPAVNNLTCMFCNYTIFKAASWTIRRNTVLQRMTRICPTMLQASFVRSVTVQNMYTAIMWQRRYIST